jgi:acetyl esterase/lipase
VAKVPEHIALTQDDLGGVPTEILASPGANTAKAIFYIHGGGWVGGSPATHRALTWRLAEQVGVPVYAVDYRLAPEHPYPAGLDDCLAAYRALLAKGIAPADVVVGGDSAGGNLTLALALRLKAEGTPQPAALVCLSPATDLATGTASHTSNAKKDAMFDPRTFRTIGKYYFPGVDGTDPFISPRRGDPSGLPPVLFHASAVEMLRDDSVLMAQKMRDAGVATEIEIWPGVPHVWHVMADMLPEGRAAIAKVVAFIKTQLKL